MTWALYLIGVLSIWAYGYDAVIEQDRLEAKHPVFASLLLALFWPIVCLAGLTLWCFMNAAAARNEFVRPAEQREDADDHQSIH